MKDPLVSIPVELKGTPEHIDLLRQLISKDARESNSVKAAIRAIMTEPFIEALHKKALELREEGRL